MNSRWRQAQLTFPHTLSVKLVPALLMMLMKMKIIIIIRDGNEADDSWDIE